MFPSKGNGACETEWGPTSQAHAWEKASRLRTEQAKYSPAKKSCPKVNTWTGVSIVLGRRSESQSWTVAHGSCAS